MPTKRWLRKAQERIERDRDEAIAQLRRLGVSPEANGNAPARDTEQARDEGDQAQASERAELEFMTRERLAERINRLTAALERLLAGSYGTCEICGEDIEPARLEALPEAKTCLRCQRDQERAA
jgi:DnaK suppressor protein